MAARHGALAVAAAGLVSLAVAMGIGRFAFTPILPLMLADTSVDLLGASWLATANYLGYLAGALLCTFAPWLRARLPRLPALDAPWLVRGGLVATGVLTLGMWLPAPVVWPALRFAAGVASAVVFVYTSGWCLARLAERGASALGGVMYAGPGAGIVASGLLASAMVAADWRATTAWAAFGVLAFVLTALVWRTFAPMPAPRDGTVPAAAAAPARTEARHGRTEVASLALAYGIAGFGYIVTATFLPVIARAAIPGSPWLDLFWPIFGGGVVAGALLATRLHLGGDLRLLLAAAYAVQAAGIGIGVAWPTATGFALGSALLGIPFTAITFFAMQEVRRIRPDRVASTMGLLTTLYGLGQIVGPPMVAAFVAGSASAGAGFTRSLVVAAAALLAGAALFFAMSRRWPAARN